LAFCFVVVLGLVGCGGGSKKFAPVSGTVTLNGNPLPDAEVSFQPIAAEGSIEAGIGSNGKTDDKGHFTLKAPTGEDGALVGKHQVRISLFDARTESDVRVRPGAKANKVPQKYNGKTELTFDVPRGGTDQANFDLKSR
jgi:hypothetical protein